MIIEALIAGSITSLVAWRYYKRKDRKNIERRRFLAVGHSIDFMQYLIDHKDKLPKDIRIELDKYLSTLI